MNCSYSINGEFRCNSYIEEAKNSSFDAKWKKTLVCPTGYVKNPDTNNSKEFTTRLDCGSKCAGNIVDVNCSCACVLPPAPTTTPAPIIYPPMAPPSLSCPLGYVQSYNTYKSSTFANSWECGANCPGGNGRSGPTDDGCRCSCEPTVVLGTDFNSPTTTIVCPTGYVQNPATSNSKNFTTSLECGSNFPGKITDDGCRPACIPHPVDLGNGLSCPSGYVQAPNTYKSKNFTNGLGCGGLQNCAGNITDDGCRCACVLPPQI
jgi:hypothetical protein